MRVCSTLLMYEIKGAVFLAKMLIIILWGALNSAGLTIFNQWHFPEKWDIFAQPAIQRGFASKKTAASLNFSQNYIRKFNSGISPININFVEDFLLYPCKWKELELKVVFVTLRDGDWEIARRRTPPSALHSLLQCSDSFIWSKKFLLQSKNSTDLKCALFKAEL